MFTFPVLVVFLLFIIIGVGVGFLIVKIKTHSRAPFVVKAKNEVEAIHQVNKRLSKNPNDAGALKFAGDYHYKKGEWEKALEAYQRLVELPSGIKGADETAANLRLGEVYIKLGQTDEAYKCFAVAHTLDRDNFEVNYNLGAVEFQRKNYDKAVQLLTQTHALHPEHVPTVRTLGHALFKLRKTRDALQFIKQSIDMAPDDKESLMILAQCYHESGQTDQAFRIYKHLRPDAVWGAEACLSSGTLNAECHHDEAAIADFEIGLKHKNIQTDIKLEMNYQLANAYIRLQDISKAMRCLKEISTEKADYKDTAALITQYKELYSNLNLRTYTLAPSSDFLTLCRRFVIAYFPKARVKVAKTMMQANDWADIVAEVNTPKWADVVMFRFIRTQGSIGELVVRDFHSHLREAKAGKGICVGVGVYSEEARRFIEARLIDLIDKPKLIQILNNIGTERVQPLEL
ncbi:MAG: tetratricopeptide repeat protein [Spirochaetaceae bacterium]|jgi:tetratricopeptide (TPR) repeat protein|nr:tetratricopeptide repeat protein [Spirochaetaceae bacterium]